MLEIPSRDATDALKLADWLELVALLDPDGNASTGDIHGALRIASYNGITSDEAIERKMLEVFSELHSRARAAGDAYPFAFPNPQLLQLKSEAASFPAYVFCLCLSYRGAEKAKDATQLFEELACRAAGNYLHGTVVRFGSPRKELPKGFSKAITHLCGLLGEGEGFRSQPTNSAKDHGLDVVAWKEFTDRSGSKLLLFGQCAAGWDWQDKLTELQPDAFWDNWIRVPTVSPRPLKSLFIPHRIERGRWDQTGRLAGILFDRCRIAHLTHEDTKLREEYHAWAKGYLGLLAQA